MRGVAVALAAVLLACVLTVGASGDTGGQFQPYQAFPVGSSPDAVAIGDVTGDGRNDVVLTTWFASDPAHDYRLWVLAQAPDGTLLAPVSYATAAGYANGPDSVAVGDITGDGRADVVVGIAGAGVQVFPQLQSGLLGPPTLYATVDSGKIRLGQLNGDGRLDVAGIGWGTNTVAVLLNNGSGGLAPAATYSAPHAGYDDLEVGDVTGDGRDDVVVMSGQSYAVPNVSVLPQLGGGGFGQAVSYSLGPNVLSNGIGVGDVTGDGLNDVVASYGGNQPSSHVAVLAQQAGSLAAPQTYTSYDVPQATDVADVDLDGRVDVVTLHGGWQALGLDLQQPDGTLGPEQLFTLPYASHYNPHGLALGDLNGDGSPDVAIADPNNGLLVLRNRAVPTSAPRAPALTAAIAAPGSVGLVWRAPSSAGGAPSGYRIYRGTASGGETLLATVGSATSFTDASIAPGTTYYYRVAGFNSLGDGALSNELAAPVTLPGAPQLTAAGGNASVALSWTPPASNGGSPITSYTLYRGATSGGETLLGHVGGTSYTDANVGPGQTYFYTVTATNAVGEGSASAERAATVWTTPGPPTLTSAKGVTNGITLTWTAPSSNGGTPITAYRIYRGAAAGAETLLTTVGNVATYTDTGVGSGKTFYYKVSAVNAVGEGSRSNELSAKRGH